MMQLATRFAGTAATLRSASPLTEDQIRQVAPSVFAPDKAPTRSERYTYIPTIDVLRGLAREGFAPFMVAQSRSRDAAMREHTKHMIRLRHASQISGREANEIILVNSHNGTSSYQMLAGVLRFACMNGHVAGEIHEDIRIPHKGDVIDRVIEGAWRVVDGFGAVDVAREAMQATALSAPQQVALARAALALRFDAPEGVPPPVTEAQLLLPRRTEDEGADLWSTFNRVQENAVRGGLEARSPKGRRVRTRAVDSIDRSVALNRALWVLAEEMRRLVA